MEFIWYEYNKPMDGRFKWMIKINATSRSSGEQRVAQIAEVNDICADIISGLKHEYDFRGCDSSTFFNVYGVVHMSDRTDALMVKLRYI